MSVNIDPEGPRRSKKDPLRLRKMWRILEQLVVVGGWAGVRMRPAASRNL